MKLPVVSRVIYFQHHLQSLSLGPESILHTLTIAPEAGLSQRVWYLARGFCLALQGPWLHC